MIPVQAAREIIAQHCKPLLPVLTTLTKAAGKILAQDVIAAYDIPAYPQSSVDGFAFNHEGYIKNRRLTVKGEMAAGDSKEFFLQPNEAVRIFTGAPVPAGADTVVMQEKAIVENNILTTREEPVACGVNVRPAGSEIKAGAQALETGSMLTPGAIGFLAGIGTEELLVYPSPLVSVIVTGNELQPAGQPLQYGRVYESNSFTLEAALSLLSIGHIQISHAKDDLAEITAVLNTALEHADIVLLTGGVSVGDYDFTPRAAENCGVEKLFHKVKQKPGKPLYFGKKNNRIIFGLPGNPSSVLTCFYQYVVPAIQMLMNNKNGLQQRLAVLQTSIKKPAGLTHFLKGFFDGEKVLPLPAQESYRMRSFAKANCLAEIDEEVTHVEEGEQVIIYLLPGC